MRHCEDCGTRISGGLCPNCDEAEIIIGQYADQGMDPPSQYGELVNEYKRQQKRKNS